MMSDKDDTDSEWDSTLDFTSPRQENKVSRPPEIEDEDASHHDSIMDKPKPKERTTVPFTDQKPEDYTYAEVVRKEKQPQKISKESPPPYNFRAAVSGNITPQQNDPPPPGKDRKGTTYDVSKTPIPVSQQESIMSTGSWDDTDEDEKTLKELRETFKTEKKKEQEAEELRLKLESQAEDKPDEGQLTNRSEATWKSWASFGSKLGRSSNRSNKGKKKKKEGKTVPTYKDEGHYDAVDIAQVRAGIQRQNPPPVNVFQAQPQKEVKEQPVEPEKIEDVNYTDFKPAAMPPPYIIKEEAGTTYYFGHGAVQYLEVDNEEEEAMMPKLADRLETIFQRIWQEFFGALRIVTSFFILFVVELFKYIIKYVFQPIFIGIFITTGDYVMKPVLSVLFNGFMHPTGVFCWNCCVTTKVVCNPIVEILRKILLQFAMCCRSVRCAQIFWKTGEYGPRTIEEEEIKHV